MSNADSTNNQNSAPLLTKAASNLIWLDCEMTGLDPDKERIIEIAIIITNQDLSIQIEGPNLVIHQSDKLLAAMDAWNTSMHNKTGLVAKVKASTLSEERAEEEILRFIRKYVPKNKSPMCGNTIGQDRRFLAKYMPKLESYFHYRNLDVSTLKELAGRWRSDLKFNKQQKHTALADVQESIDELIYYREHFLKL